MKTLKDIQRAAREADGHVEEDCGYRDMRLFQLVAPAGKLWAGTGCKCNPVQWACGTTPHAVAHNEAAFSSILETLSHGLREMTPDEADEYAED
jgi:hypothetical protein